MSVFMGVMEKVFWWPPIWKIIPPTLLVGTAAMSTGLAFWDIEHNKYSERDEHSSSEAVLFFSNTRCVISFTTPVDR